MHVHKKIDIAVDNPFVEKFAKRYIDQRSQTKFDYSGIDSTFLMKTSGFSTADLESVIRKNSVAKDFEREKGHTPRVLRDIYRSDLGELLMTYYFEEKITNSDKYVIPSKNITNRERCDMPGRGLDAVGYRYSGGKINLLLGEAKVSHDKRSPPSVVHTSSDSIYATQKGHKDNIDTVIQKLSDYCRQLGNEHAGYVTAAIMAMIAKKTDKYSITYGCCLLRDYTCVNDTDDYGMLKTHTTDFDPDRVYFSLMSFKGKTIEETVKLFYDKVQLMVA